MEFKLMNPTQEQDLSKMMICFNNEELKKEISEAVKKYENIVYTDKNIGEAKADRATLNKFKDALEGKRKEIKKAYLIPYEEFEKQIKELTAIVDKPISLIDSKVKEYETIAKEEKTVQIQEIYESKVGNLKELLPLDKVWNDRWLNVTYKIKDITQEITEVVSKTADDLKVIEGLGTEFELQVKDKYLQTLDLSEALKEKTRIEEQKKRLESLARSVDEGKSSQGTNTRQVEENRCTQAEATSNEEEEALEQIDFRCWVNRSQKAKLRQFMLDNNIKYGSVK